MREFSPSRWRALFVREILESKVSLFWAPIAIALAISVLLFVSVLASSRSVFLNDLLPGLIESSGQDRNINITIDSDSSGAYTVEKRETFKDQQPGAQAVSPPNQLQDNLLALMRDNNISLNPLFNALHSCIMMVLLLVSVNYLLASLHIDRRDRSVLFWRSMPVSEWEEVLSKLATVLLVVPAIYIGASVFTQILLLLNTILLVMRWDMDPFVIVFPNLHWGQLVASQAFAFLQGVLLLLPVYAWLLFASAAARRSPFMTALAPVVVVILLERFVIGSDFLATAVWSRIPGYAQGVGFSSLQLSGAGFEPVSIAGLVAGLVFALIALAAAVYLRRYRFDS
jgi:ABC-2 type transport system permease protein